jgi:hypothetical protein
VNTDTFYATAAGLCFALLGFWWVVVQFRHRELTHERSHRRLAFVVSLHYILPGLMSLAALLAADQGILWRLAFASAGAAGMAGALVAARTVRSPVGAIALVSRGEWIALPLYAALTAVALAPSVVGEATGLAPLQVEGLLIVGILLLGLLFSWALFTDPGASEPGAPA